MPVYNFSESITDVANEVKSVGYLDDAGCANSRGLGICRGAVTGNHFDARMLLKPIDDGVSPTAHNDIDWTPFFKIAKNGPICTPTPESKVVNPKDPWGSDGTFTVVDHSE